VNAGMFFLALRRACAPATVLVWAFLLLLSLLHGWSGDRSLLEAAAGEAAEALAAGMTREGVFGILVLTGVPLLVVRVARTVSAWRSGEGEWLGCRTAGRASVLASTWTGALAGALLLLVLSTAAVEVRAREAGTALRHAGRLEPPAEAWVEPGAALVWTLPDPGGRAPAGSRVRIDVGFGLGGGSASEVELRARRIPSGAPGNVARGRTSTRGTIEVELPPGEGDVELVLARPGSGARHFAIRDSAQLWVPCPSARAASSAILARLGVSLACWLALALGLGAWMSAPSAAAAVLAAWLPAWLADRPPSWLPGGDLWTALAITGEGRVPIGVDGRSLAVGAALVLVGLGIGAAGLRRWRVAS